MSAFQKTIITVSILTLAMLAIGVLIIYPAIQDIKSLNDRIQIERASLENKYTSRRNIKNIIADLNNAKTIIEKLEPGFITDKNDIVLFLEKLEKIAEKNNLSQVIKILPQNAEPEKLAQKYPVSITLAGDYVDTIKYLNELEAENIYINLESINISSVNASKSPGALSSGEVKTTLQTYAYFSL